MTFYIYRTKIGYELSDGEIAISYKAEDEAIDAAVRMAQDVNAKAYKINYWRPL